eukprot:6374027-Pyramimonas_sp.AAC.1
MATCVCVFAIGAVALRCALAIGCFCVAFLQTVSGVVALRLLTCDRWHQQCLHEMFSLFCQSSEDLRKLPRGQANQFRIEPSRGGRKFGAPKVRHLQSTPSAGWTATPAAIDSIN